MTGMDPLVDRLTKIADNFRASGQSLEYLDIIAARDAVEVKDDLLASVRSHKVDTDHLESKGFSVRLADRMLYEETGLTKQVKEAL